MSGNTTPPPPIKTSAVCSAEIINIISSTEKFNAWKTIKSGSLNTLTSSIPDPTKPGTIPTPTQQTSLATISSEIFKVAACTQEKLTEVGTTTNQIQKAQEDIMRLTNEIRDAEADVAVSRDRVAYIRHPEEHTSNYESWFPINRPMQIDNVPYFMGITLFLFVLSGLICLSLLGINVNVIISPYIISLLRTFMAQFTWFTVIQTLLIIFLIYYFVIQKQSSS